MKEYTKQDLDGLKSGERGQIIDGEISYVVVGEVAYKLSEVIEAVVGCSKPKKEKKEDKPKESKSTAKRKKTSKK